MLVSDNIYNNKSNMVYCSATFTHNYLIMVADDYFYNYVGKFVNVFITDIIHPDYKKEFMDVCNSLKEGETQRIIAYIRGKDDAYSLVHILLSNTGHIIEDNSVIEAQIYNIFNMEKKYCRLHDDADKYRKFLSMYNDYLFDYDTSNGMVAIYIYRSLKATMIKKLHIDDFEKYIMTFLNNARHKQDFRDFICKLRNANEGFNAEFTGPLITDMSKLGVYKIDCRIIYKYNRSKFVIGVIKSLGAQTEEAYYATQEGKDFFTGLLNKRACREYVSDAIASNKDKHYVAMIDIDDFKSINDTYGHLYGDKVILKVASIINRTLNGRGIVGRFGGDEFFIFTNWITTESQLRSILTFLKQKVREELSQGEQGSIVTLSIGVCLYPDYGGDYDSLVNKADKCLYIAKNKGKNRYIIYDPAKHADFIDDMGRKGFSMAPVMKGENLSQEIADMAIDIVKNGVEAIERALPRVCKAFEIDGVRVYNATKGKLISYSGEYNKLPDILDIIKTDKFMSKFEEKHYVTIVYTSNIESFYKELYDAIVECNIGGMIYSYFKNDDGDNIVVFYDTFNKSFRWNESDKNYIMTLTRIIASAL